MEPASPEHTAKPQQPETNTKTSASKIVVAFVKDEWNSNQGRKKKYSLIFGISARKNKIYESLIC